MDTKSNLIFITTICTIFLMINAAYCVANNKIKVVRRHDGTFDYLPETTETKVKEFFTQNKDIKPIKLSTVITEPYYLSLTINHQLYHLFIPKDYVTDGASKPFKHSFIPNDFEGAYWVYHDYMYQKQAFDDGTPITKELADEIMDLLILTEWKTIMYPYKIFYKFIVNIYKNSCDTYWTALKSRGCAKVYNGDNTTSAPTIQLAPDKYIKFEN